MKYLEQYIHNLDKDAERVRKMAMELEKKKQLSEELGQAVAFMWEACDYMKEAVILIKEDLKKRGEKDVQVCNKH